MALDRQLNMYLNGKLQRIKTRYDRWLLPLGPGLIIPTCWNGSATSLHDSIECRNCERKGVSPPTFNLICAGCKGEDQDAYALALSQRQLRYLTCSLQSQSIPVDSPIVISIIPGCGGLNRTVAAPYEGTYSPAWADKIWVDSFLKDILEIYFLGQNLKIPSILKLGSDGRIADVKCG